MAATLHVLARFIAKPGQEQALKAVLTALIAPTRREIGCYQYDLLESTSDAREFCFVERWDGEGPLDRHFDTAHVKSTLTLVEPLIEGGPDIRRYRII